MWAMTCPVCRGTREDCEECDGSGQVHQRRCPAATIGPGMGSVIRHYHHFRAGLLPDSGGIADQANVFLSFCEIANSEKAAIDEERAKEEKRKSRKGSGKR